MIFFSVRAVGAVRNSSSSLNSPYNSTSNKNSMLDKFKLFNSKEKSKPGKWIFKIKVRVIYLKSSFNLYYLTRLQFKQWCNFILLVINFVRESYINYKNKLTVSCRLFNKLRHIAALSHCYNSSA